MFQHPFSFRLCLIDMHGTGNKSRSKIKIIELLGFVCLIGGPFSCKVFWNNESPEA